MKSAIKFLAFVSVVMVVYFLSFIMLAGVLHAEHWSYMIAAVPAFLSGAAVLGGRDK